MPYPGLLPPEPLPCSSGLLQRQRLWCNRPGYGISPLGRGHHYPTTEPPLGRHKQNLVHTRTQEKGAVTPQETDPDLPGSLQWRRGSAWPAAGLGALSTAVHHGTFEGGLHYPHHLHHSLVSGQKRGREHSPAFQQKIGLKIY